MSMYTEGFDNVYIYIWEAKNGRISYIMQQHATITTQGIINHQFPYIITGC